MNRPLEIAGQRIANIEIDVERIYGESALGKFVVKFQVQFHPKEDDTLQVYAFSCSVETAFKAQKSKIYYKLAPAETSRLQMELDRKSHTQIQTLHFYLSKEQLARVEQHRNGDDVFLKLNIRCLVDGYNSGTRQEAHSETEIILNQKRWLEVLSQMGYQDFMLVEIALPKQDNASSYKSILDQYAKANTQLINGEFTSAVNTCRLALEALERKSQLKVIEAKKTLCKSHQDQIAMKLEERLKLLLFAVKNPTHLAHHPNEENEEDMFTEFSRSQAQLIVGTTGLLLSYYMQQGEQNAD